MKFSILACLLTGVQSLVLEATDADLTDHLSKKIPTILTFYAEWCSHCKTFAPLLEQLSNEYDGLKDSIQFVRINGDVHQRASTSFQLKYFPTVMYVDSDGHEEIQSRDLNSSRMFIREKTGSAPGLSTGKKQPKVSQRSEDKAQNEAQQAGKPLTLIDDNFEESVLGKRAFVAFTTEWCSYCKQLKPDWNKLAEIYERDDDVVIANVDCTDMDAVQNLIDTFKIKSFPTIIYIPAEAPHSESVYKGPRSSYSLVDYLQIQGVDHRYVDGSLNDGFGVIHKLRLDNLANNVDRVLEDSQQYKSPYKDVYEKILNKSKDDKSYVKNEFGRVSEILSGSLTPADRDKFSIKRNISTSLLDALETEEKREL